MKGIIDGIDFYNLEIERYYAPPNSWSEEKRKENAVSKIFSGDWVGAQKRDGAFYMFIKDEDGNQFLRGRSKSVSGVYLDKYELVPHLHEFFNQLPPGTCLLGEIYLPRDEQAKTTTSFMNCLPEKAIKRQQKEEDKLHYYVFDILADEGKSLINTPAEERFNLLNSYWHAYGENYNEWARYYEGKELWNKLQELLADGYEGIVITRKGATYKPGKRTNQDTLKVKKELQDTIDCVVMGANPPSKLYTGKEIESWPYWFNEITNEKILETDIVKNPTYKSYVDGGPVIPVTKNWYNGWAGSLKLGAYKDGKLVEIGNLSGVTDEVKENWKDYIGKVAEITAMEIMTSESGYGLRHPKLCNFRSDKSPTECTWESIFGG